METGESVETRRLTNAEIASIKAAKPAPTKFSGKENEFKDWREQFEEWLQLSRYTLLFIADEEELRTKPSLIQANKDLYSHVTIFIDPATRKETADFKGDGVKAWNRAVEVLTRTSSDLIDL